MCVNLASKTKEALELLSLAKKGGILFLRLGISRGREPTGFEVFYLEAQLSTVHRLTRKRKEVAIRLQSFYRRRQARGGRNAS